MPSWANLVSALFSEGDTLKKYLHFPWEGVQGFVKADGDSGMASERM